MSLPSLENMSPHDYIRYAKGNNIGCPVCRSREVIHEYCNQPSGETMEQTTFCKDCESTWVEEYSMVTYYNIRYKKEKNSGR